MKKVVCPLFLSLVLAGACHNGPDSGTETPSAGGESVSETPVITYSVVNAFPHDKNSYTEGFLVHNGKIYESSGAPADNEKTRSILGIVNFATGDIDVKAELDKKIYFGEGITILNDKLYQLTWTNKKGFIYDLKTFKKTGEFNIPSNEGWGMTTDGTYLILSDGSSNLTWLDPVSFKTIKVVGVTDNNGPVGNLNELEFVKGNILANIYQTPYIVRIDPSSGKVLGKADFSNLIKEVKLKSPDVDYMNGIAWDSAADKLYITGKLWPNLYEVKLNN
jgi:glutamine cyclotransferase